MTLSTTERKASLGKQFTGQLAQLMQQLYRTEPHYIRCIKPNESKQPYVHLRCHPATLQAAVRTACCWALRCRAASGLEFACAARSVAGFGLAAVRTACCGTALQGTCSKVASGLGSV